MIQYEVLIVVSHRVRPCEIKGQGERNESSLSNQELKGDLSAFMRKIIAQMGLKVKSYLVLVHCFY